MIWGVYRATVTDERRDAPLPNSTGCRSMAMPQRECSCHWFGGSIWLVCLVYGGRCAGDAGGWNRVLLVACPMTVVVAALVGTPLELYDVLSASAEMKRIYISPLFVYNTSPTLYKYISRGR